jgi:hypothetical protein
MWQQQQFHEYMRSALSVGKMLQRGSIDSEVRLVLRSAGLRGGGKEAPQQRRAYRRPAATTKAGAHRAPRPASLTRRCGGHSPGGMKSPTAALHAEGAAIAFTGCPCAKSRKRPLQPIAMRSRRVLRGWVPSGHGAGGGVGRDLSVLPGKWGAHSGPIGEYHVGTTGGDGTAYLAEGAGVRRGVLLDLCSTLLDCGHPGGHEVPIAETRRRGVGSVRTRAASCGCAWSPPSAAEGMAEPFPSQ